MAFDFDVIIIGSGFGATVMALDQAGKGVRERQEEEVDVALARDAELEQRLDGREVVAVGLDHALGRQPPVP